MSGDTAQAKSLLSYEKPPIIEVACGIQFEPIQGFKAPHSGLLWTRFGDEYPNCEHAAPIGLNPATFETATGLPLPRIWFITKGGSNLIQVQNDRFHFNWRKRSQGEAYPRFDTVLHSFKKNFGIFAELIKESGLGPINPIECELLYINHIPKEDGWESAADTQNILPDLAWRSIKKRFLKEPLSIGWQTSFALPEDCGRLNVSLQQGERQSDKLPILRLEFVARGLGEDKSPDALWEWFELAHKWIVFGFADLTNPKIQKEVWGLKN